MAYKKSARATAPKGSYAEKPIAELKRLEREEAAFVKALHDPSRQHHALYTYGSNSVELLSELANDAVNKGNRKTVRKLEGAISRLLGQCDRKQAVKHLRAAPGFIKPPRPSPYKVSDQ